MPGCKLVYRGCVKKSVVNERFTTSLMLTLFKSLLLNWFPEVCSRTGRWRTYTNDRRLVSKTNDKCNHKYIQCNLLSNQTHVQSPFSLSPSRSLSLYLSISPLSIFLPPSLYVRLSHITHYPTSLVGDPPAYPPPPAAVSCVYTPGCSVAGRPESQETWGPHRPHQTS